MPGIPIIGNTARRLTSPSGGGTVELPLDFLPQKIEGLWAHLTSILLKVNLALTESTTVSEDDEGEDLVRHSIDEIELLRVDGERVYSLKGYQARLLSQLEVGALPYADPADVVGVDPAAGQSRVAYVEIKFYGGKDGVRGFHRREDLYQPTFLFNGGAAALRVKFKGTFGGYSSFTSVPTVDATFHCEGLREAILGCQLYRRTVSTSETTNPRLSSSRRLLNVSLVKPDRAPTYTSVRCPQHSLIPYSATPEQLAMLFNLHARPANVLVPTAPEQIPVLFPTKESGFVLGSVAPDSEQLKLETSTSESENVFLVSELGPISEAWLALRSSTGCPFTRFAANALRNANARDIDPKKAAVLQQFGPKMLA